MKVQIRVLENGTKVRIPKPGPGERGVWLITGVVQRSGMDDPAYDIQNYVSGRRRIKRRSQLRVMRGT